MKYLIFCTIGLIALTACNAQTGSGPSNLAVAGSINLQKHDFTNAGSVDLDGDWEYYPGEIVNPEDLAKKQTARKMARVPRSFNSYINPSLRLAPAASATYRLTMQLPEKLAMYVIRIPPPATASKVFINNHLELETGHVSERHPKLWPPVECSIFTGRWLETRRF